MKKRILSIASIIVLGFSIVSAQTEIPVKTVSGGVLNGKAKSLAKPTYPSAARAVNAEGAVSVQVVIDEEGNIASANAISGHPLLRQAAEQAALESKFAPTSLSGQPVRVTGIITYNFVAGAAAQNWVKTGYDLASYEKFSASNSYGLDSLSAKFPVEWTNEREQLKQLQTMASENSSSARTIVKDSMTIRTVENATVTVEKTPDDVAVKKMIAVQNISKPLPASAEQTAIVQNLTASLQSRLGNDPQAAWQLNLGIALGRALTNIDKLNSSQILISALRQQISAAPADVAPRYLESANKIVALLEAEEKTPEQRQQMGQLLSALFKN